MIDNDITCCKGLLFLDIAEYIMHKQKYVCFRIRSECCHYTEPWGIPTSLHTQSSKHQTQSHSPNIGFLRIRTRFRIVRNPKKPIVKNCLSILDNLKERNFASVKKNKRYEKNELIESGEELIEYITYV